MNKIRFLQFILDMLPFSVRSTVKYIPGLRQLQEFIMRRFMNGNEFVSTISAGPAKGLVFPVKLPQDKHMWIGTWESNFANSLYETVQKGWVCFDIGGYKGYYAGIMALKGAKDVYVFEPMPYNADKIRTLIELNSSLPVKLQVYAISDEIGEATFQLMPEETMGKLDKSAFQKDDVPNASIKVATVTLDFLLEQGLPDPDFIKIDVEGAEEFVLKGAVRLLERKKPLLMIEVHSHEIGVRCLQILQQYYNKISVLETGKFPDGSETTICHYIASSI